jgi:hypothetical protein
MSFHWTCSIDIMGIEAHPQHGGGSHVKRCLPGQRRRPFNEQTTETHSREESQRVTPRAVLWRGGHAKQKESVLCFVDWL